MEHIRLECLKIASAEVLGGLWGPIGEGAVEPQQQENVMVAIYTRAEALVAWIAKAPGGPASPEPDYERLPASVEGA